MNNFLEEEIKNFEVVEEDIGEQNAEKINSRRRHWVGTWNNPSMADEEFTEFLQNLYNTEVLQYAIFQREKGEENGTIHFQFYLNFKNPQYFKKIKEKILPYGCHFKPMISTPERCKAYCSKEETRVSGYYEIGEWEDERQRSDLKNAIKMIDEGVSFEVVSKIYPSQCVMYSTQLKERASSVLKEKFSLKCRNVEVYLIYGKGGVGKTSSVYMRYGFEDVFFVSNYEKYLFEGYNGKKIIVFDEFAGQIEITTMNRYLDIYPLSLRGLGKTYPACYEKVFILSNLTPKELYANLDENKKKSLEPFFRRIHHIVYVDENGVEHIEKQTIFRDLQESEIKLTGLTRVIDRTLYYDVKSGKCIREEYRNKPQQMELRELTEKEKEGMPWQS